MIQRSLVIGKHLSFVNLKSLCRFMWAIVHILSLSGLSYIIVDTLSIYSHKPLITSLYDTIYPVDKVPFPGIAICNINRISYSQAKAYAEYL